ncbi:hypothetical protein [Coleofasciculus sp. E1-EBD-02]|uniref:hypothetical protein n=1 Tax=Coleofasciculus sp. E1-EBD-02 TaxID=3068481 RepID=UPI0032FF4939
MARTFLHQSASWKNDIIVGAHRRAPFIDVNLSLAIKIAAKQTKSAYADYREWH